MKRSKAGKFLVAWEGEPKKRVNLSLTATAWNILEQFAQAQKISRSEAVEHYARSLQAGRSQVEATVTGVPLADDSLAPVKSQAKRQPLRPRGDGTVEGLVALVREGSDRQQSEATIQFQAHLLDAVEQAVIATDLNGQITYWNQFAETLYGWFKTDVIGRNILEITPAQVSQEQAAEIMARLQQGQRWSGEFWVQRHDGTPFLALVTNSPIYDHQGALIGVIGVSVDATERRRTEAALQESEARFRAAAGGSFDAIYILQSVRDQTGQIIDFRFTDLNSRGESLISLPKEAVINQRLCELLPVNKTGGFFEKYKQVVETKIALEEEFPISDPGITASWIHHQVVPLGDGIAITSRDITERKQAEQALQLSEARLRRLAESNIVGIVFWDADGNITEANEAFLTMTGYTRKDLLTGAVNWQQMSPAEYRQIDETALAELAAVGVCTPFEKEYIRKDNSRVAVLIHGATLDEKRDRGIAVIVDITERNQARKALQKAHDELEQLVEERTVELLKTNQLLRAEIADRQRAERQMQRTQAFLSSIVENIPNMIFVKDAQDLKFVSFNKAGEELLGYSRQELIGKNDYNFFPPDEADFFIAKDTEVLLKGRLLDIPEEQVRTRNNGVRILHTKKIPILDSAGTPQYLLGISEDITERKRSEAERAQLIREQAARAEAEAAQQRSSFLANASTVLASSLNYEITLASLVRLVLPVLADYCLIYKLEQNGQIQPITAAHQVPEKEGLVQELANLLCTHIQSPSSLTAQVLRTGEPLLISEFSYEMAVALIKDPRLLQICYELDPKSVMVLPLTARGQIFGVMLLTRAESDRRYAASDLVLAEELARRAAIAIDNAQLYWEAQQARAAAEQAADRTTRLQTVTAALSEPITPGQVAEVIVEQSQTALGVTSALVALLNETGTELEIVHSVGYEQDLEEAWRCFSVNTAAPLAEAVRTGKVVWEESTEARLARYPHLAEAYARYNYGAWISLPLMIEGRAVGAITLSFTQAPQLSEEDRAFILALAQQSAQAIDRARLYEAERTARAEAEAANRIKDEFLAIVSHELRTPLNAVLGWSQLLRTRKFDAATTARALETIERNARSQKQLIEDLLDVSRIIRGKVNLNVQPIDLVPVIQAGIEVVRLAANAKNIQIETQFERDAGLVLGDPERLQQVVWNLLSNAVKFTLEGGWIKVDLQRVESQLQIQVQDTGIGISKAFLPHVFEYFRQADGSITRSRGGLGLGLAIVRHLVELHGGTVQAISEGEGQGATFTVKLPLLLNSSQISVREQLYPAEEAALEELLILQGLQLLVVDDEADTREFLAFILEQSGAEVTAVSSAKAALRSLKQLKPDVIVSDIGMPQEDGYALLRQVRALESEATRQIPAIALTAYAGEDYRQLALAAGFQLHISKPVDAVELVKAIAKLAEAA